MAALNNQKLAVRMAKADRSPTSTPHPVPVTSPKVATIVMRPVAACVSTW